MKTIIINNAQVVSFDDTKRNITWHFTVELYYKIKEFLLWIKIDFMHMELSKIFKPRSTGWKSSNHHFNGHVMQIAKEVGDYFDETKIDIKRAAMSRGWPHRYNYKGEIVPKSEREVTDQECACGIDVCHQIAAEQGIILREDDDVKR